MIVTDWSDAKFAFSRDFTTPTYKEAIRRVIDAGVDMLMEPYSVEACDYLVELVNEKQLPMSRIDDAVRRILRLKFRLGLFDDPYGTSSDYAKFADPEFVKYAYNAALESEVLLKNDNSLLPLSKDARILLVGPNANSMRTLGG